MLTNVRQQVNQRIMPPHTFDPEEIERRLAAGWSLPSTLYVDPLVAELEQDLIWRHAWMIVGTVADFRQSGDFLATQLGRFPVVVVRGEDGTLRAFHNVCRHRGALVVGGEHGDGPDSSGNCNRFQCPYHGWTYGLDGRLRGVPNWRDGKLPPFDELGLHAIAVDTWAGIVFVSLDPEEALGEYLSGAAHVADQQGYTKPFVDDAMELVATYEWDVRANWKAFMENNLECYHCGTTHAQTLAAIFRVDIDSFCNVNYKNGNHIAAPFVPDLAAKVRADAAEMLREAAGAEQPFQQYWLWPTNMITTGVGVGNGLFRIDALGPDTCRMIGRVYARNDDDTGRAQLDQYLGHFIDEDVAISAGVQLGLRSGTREWGPLLAKREDSIRFFSELVWRHLGPAFRTSTHG